MATAPNLNHLAMRTLVGALADNGVAHAVVTPGSRNTPIAWQIAEEYRLTTWVHHDERSAAFFAVGIGKATGTPAMLSCTSGTAAAEYLPAVVEAHQSRTPLIVLTADRPPELQGIGSPQTIDQIGLYGSAVRWFHDPGVPMASEAGLSLLATAASEAWSRAVGSPAGPVHLNIPLREPLAPTIEPLADLHRPETPPAQVGQATPDTDALSRLEPLLAERRVVIVAGPGPLSPEVAGLAERHRWPVVADPLSGLRGAGSPVIESGNAIAQLGLLDERLRPDTVLRFGALPTSKAWMVWLDAHPETPQIQIHDGLWRAPAHVTALVADPDLAALAINVAPGPAQWFEAWQDTDEMIRATWAVLPDLSEPHVAQLTAALQHEDDDLWVASSMPVRDIDDFGRFSGGRVFGHRGANGIDGLISAAAGSALATGRRTRVLSGDLSLVHDMSAIGMAVRLGSDLDIVVVDNDGGGIFHFLPQADHLEHFETLLGTPHSLDLAKIATAYGANARVVESAEELLRSLQQPPDGVRVFVVKTDRVENVTIHGGLWTRLAEAFES